MLTIRLQRTGTKNKPSFRLVLAESHKASGKKFLEVLGHYNPRSKDFGIKSEDRLKYWISQNVAMSPTVHNLLVEKKLVGGKKVRAWMPKKKEGSEASAETAAPAAEAAAPAEPAAA
jgi:small subunit ribosomal protein S16